MSLFILAYVAGLLTVLAPCVLPLLPIIIGSSVTGKNKLKPYFVTLGLVISISLFTILLKASTLLINVNPMFWTFVSGAIIIAFGLVYLFPEQWENISEKLGLSSKSNNLMRSAEGKSGFLGDMLIGGALGPVFASCSPTYSLIIATILPVNFTQGILYILVYAMGLATIMLLTALLGRKLLSKLRVFADPKGWFRKSMGIIFLIVGLMIITGIDKKIETYLVTNQIFDVTQVEQTLLKNLKPQEDKKVNSKELFNVTVPYTAPEIANITQWINTEDNKSVTIESLKGKVVLLDFWTYSCINCQRTLPYLTKWYDNYKDKGFVILGIHAPEFAFEQKIENVSKATQEFKINYPVGLDNSFSTWNAYKNQFWPAHYLIDKTGQVRQTHFGEGGYQETEMAILSLLDEKNISNLLTNTIGSGENKTCSPQDCPITPETYLGSDRSINKELNWSPKSTKSFENTSQPTTNQYNLNGTWTNNPEEITSTSGVDNTLKLNFSANNVYIVLESDSDSEIVVTINNQKQNLGPSIDQATGIGKIKNAKLYQLVKSNNYIKNGILEIKTRDRIKFHAFTFG